MNSITSTSRVRRIGGGAALALVATTLCAGLTAEAAQAKAAPVDTTTAVVITPASVPYGAASEAVATVTASGTPTGPGAKKLDGDVSFTINGQTLSGKITGNDGQAKVDLPVTLPAGHSYPVVATFVPGDAASYNGSVSAAANVQVVKDNTTTTAKVANVIKGQRIKAEVAVASVNKQTVTGQVKVILKRKGKTLKTKTKTLVDGAKTVGLGVARKRGGYIVKVKYLGDSNFNASKVKTRFTVS